MIHDPSFRQALRARVRISWSTAAVEAPGWQGATKAHTRRYVTDKQRSQTGWIGGHSDRVILTRARTIAWTLAVLIALLVPRAQAKPGAFIQVKGTAFYADDQPFYFVGANLNVMHGPDARQGAGATIAAASNDGLRVGRLWALGEGLEDAAHWQREDFLFRAGPTGWQEQAYLQLDKVIAEAGQRGLRLIITLSNSWADYGGLPMYLRWAGQLDVESYGYSDRFFSDPLCKKWYAEHVRRIVGRINTITRVPYRDDPTIMAWELQNELHGTPEAAATRRRWVVEMTRFIRELDSQHLVVPGLIGYNLQEERQDWIKMCQLPEVSFCDQHIYPEEHLRSRGLRNLHRFVDDRVQLAHYVVGKPIIFGEFGFADQGSSARRSRHHHQFLARLFYDGGNGALVWIYQPTLSWKRKYGVLIDRQRYAVVRRALGQQARRVSRRGAQNLNPQLGVERGAQPIAPTHALLTRTLRIHGKWRPAPNEQSVYRTLSIPVDAFYRAWFEEAGSWDGGVLVHAYGRNTGWFEFRFRGFGGRAAKLEVRARMSSEYPGRYAPPHGYSRVRLLIDGADIARLRVRPDDGVGQWYSVTITDEKQLRQLRHGTHALRFQVDPGDQAKGVALYGRETPLNREPVEDPGPITITVCE